EAEPPVINLGLQTRAAIVHLAENDTAAAILRQPAAHHAIASAGFDDREPCVAAWVFSDAQQAAGTQGFQFGSRMAEIHEGGKGGHLLLHDNVVARIVKRRPK